MKKNLKKTSDFPIIAIGTSSGGPKALNKILEKISTGFPAAFLIVQHMPAGFTKTLAERLDNISGLKVKEAEEGDKLKAGHAFLAPGDFHLEVDKENKIRLNKKARLHGVRPCVDYMMQSLVEHYNAKRLIGVILTGMGHDGADGMTAIINKGGYGIVESKKTALVYGMPSAAIKAGAYHEIKNIEEIANKIIEMVEGQI